MDTTQNEIVSCTYLERLVPLRPEETAAAFIRFLDELGGAFAPDEPQLSLGSGRTTVELRELVVVPHGDLLLCSVPVLVRSGRIHRHGATLEVCRWSYDAATVGLRVHLRRAPRAGDGGWLAYRRAGAELLTAVAGNLVRIDQTDVAPIRQRMAAIA